MSYQKYIAERMPCFQDAYNRLDIEDSMSFYVEEADHCDYGPFQSVITLATSFYRDHYCPWGLKRLTSAASILKGNLSIHNKNTIRTFFANSFKVCGDINITTAAISGTKELSVWEWNMTFTSIKLMPGDDRKGGWANKVADGRLVKMIGVSLCWWNADDKIIKQHDYTKVVKDFEGLR